MVGVKIDKKKKQEDKKRKIEKSKRTKNMEANIKCIHGNTNAFCRWLISLVNGHL